MNFADVSKSILLYSCEFILSFDSDVIKVEEVIAGNIVETYCSKFWNKY